VPTWYVPTCQRYSGRASAPRRCPGSGSPPRSPVGPGGAGALTEGLDAAPHYPNRYPNGDGSDRHPRGGDGRRSVPALGKREATGGDGTPAADSGSENWGSNPCSPAMFSLLWQRKLPIAFARLYPNAACLPQLALTACRRCHDAEPGPRRGEANSRHAGQGRIRIVR
jgi:hypothetical protein